ncbi:MAG TPA: N-acetyltransferase [Acidimicrobiales bacterium]|nr:N-acetyltransferase [Acidimicrobiales bacterium]
MSVTNTTGVMERGRERLRAGSWRGDPTTAFLAPVPGGPAPSFDFVQWCLARLAEQRYRRVVTCALSQSEQAPFRLAGFTVSEHLHLLSHDLRRLPTATGRLPLRRATGRDQAAVLAVDRLAFDSFWRLDPTALEEALSATPHTRFRVATAGDGDGAAVVAYAITGRANRRGFLQRLAVDPAHQRLGIGFALVVDALRWLRRWRVDQAMVNTQLANGGALALYERAGFKREPTGLSVLHRRLDG